MLKQNVIITVRRATGQHCVIAIFILLPLSLPYHLDLKLKKNDGRSVPSMFMFVCYCCYFQDPDTWSALQARFKRPLSAGVLKDVYDGEGYKSTGIICHKK